MSLRSRVLIGMALIAVVLVTVGVIVIRATDNYLVQRVDEQLEAAARPDRGWFRPPRPGQRYAPSSLYVAWFVGGEPVLITPPGFPGDDEPLPVLDAEEVEAEAERSDPRPFTVPADSGDSEYRVLARQLANGETIVVGLSLRDVDAATNRLLLFVGIGVTLALAVLALVTWWVIRLGVRPIKRMTATATAIAEGDLSHRVEPAAAGTEAAELGTALNTMLGRIEAAFDEREASEQRLRQFVADASHELRTPVTSIRGYAELYQRGALDDEAALAQAMRRTEQESIRMGHLIDDLLLLARLDQGRPLELARVDLARLVDDAVLDAGAVDPDRPITADVVDDLHVRGDEHRLHQVMANVLANALRHTPAGTPVQVRLSRVGPRCVLEVHDDGPGMTPEVASHAFERFYRADPSRSRDRGGSGLGLAIVQAIVEAHRGSVTLNTEPGRGTTVRIELPADDEPRPTTTAATPEPARSLSA